MRAKKYLWSILCVYFCYLTQMCNVNVDRNAALCYNYKKFIMHIFS